MKYLTTILLLLLLGCNPAKKLLKSQHDFDAIGQEWAKKNPCANDTTITHVDGGTDTLFVDVPFKDTAAIKKAIDSVSKALAKKYGDNAADCNRQVNEAYQTGYDQAMYLCGKVKIPVKRPDTITKVILDNRSIEAITDTESAYSKDLAAQKDISAKYLAQRNTGFIIAGIELLLLIILIILLLKKPL